MIIDSVDCFAPKLPRLFSFHIYLGLAAWLFFAIKAEAASHHGPPLDQPACGAGPENEGRAGAAPSATLVRLREVTELLTDLQQDLSALIATYPDQKREILEANPRLKNPCSPHYAILREYWQDSGLRLQGRIAAIRPILRDIGDQLDPGKKKSRGWRKKRRPPADPDSHEAYKVATDLLSEVDKLIDPLATDMLCEYMEQKLLIISSAEHSLWRKFFVNPLSLKCQQLLATVADWLHGLPTVSLGIWGGEFTAFECPICYVNEVTTPTDGFIVTCGHNCCRPCANQYYSQASEAAGHTNLKCMTCPKIIDGKELDQLELSPLATAHNRIRELTEMATSLGFRHQACPAPHCVGQVFLSESSASAKATCPICHADVCLECKAIHRGSRPCEDSAAERLIEEKIAAGEYKRCPNCDVPTERIAGCNRIFCENCHFEWHWLTRTKWRGYGNGGEYTWAGTGYRWE